MRYFLFASEIALEAMLQQSASSLDEILCDPALAARFDELAARFAPGHRPFEYRWGALKLRKQAKVARCRGAVLTAPSSLDSPILLDDSDRQGQLDKLADSPGLYLVTGNGEEPLYIGETVSLRNRLSEIFRPQQCRHWMNHGRTQSLSIQTYVTDSPAPQMLAWQSCLLRKYATRFNLRELRVAQ